MNHRSSGRLETASFSIDLAASVESVWAFVCDPRNLDSMTPPWLRFRVRTPMPIELAPGVEVDYRLSWRRVPLRWRSRLTVVDPHCQLTYEQCRGPYRSFVHVHQFTAIEGGTRMTDRVDWMARFAWLSRRWVARDLEALFAHRAALLAGRFGLRP